MSDIHTKDLLDSDMPNIVDQYRRLIHVPAFDRHMQQFLLCPIGLVGAGKSTVIKPLSKMLSLVRISGDEIRKVLMDNGFNTKRAWEVGGKLIDEYARKGCSVAIDTDCAAPKTIDGIKKLCKELEIPAIWIHIAPPEDFIITKLRNYKHTWLFKNADHAIDVYNKRKPLHENLNFPFVYTFDTSLDTVDLQVQEAYETIMDSVLKSS